MAKAATMGRAPVYGASGLMPQPYVDKTRGRTNNRLIRGPHVDIIPMHGLEVDPAPQVAAKQMEYKWTWDNNTASQGQCVLPKGNMVAFNNSGLLDYADIHANPASATVGQTRYVSGLSYLNLFKPVADRLSANRPGIAVRGYFELPVFESYDDADAAEHVWGAIVAPQGILPGDVLRICGSDPTNSNADGTRAPGWFTNVKLQHTTLAASAQKLDPYDDIVIAQIFEFDDGPVFDGLAEWVQFDNPFEFEFGKGFWTGNPADDGYAAYDGEDRRFWRDPNSNTLFSYGPNDAGKGMYPYDPRLQDPWFRDAMGIPNLSDGANWQTWQQDRFTLDNTGGALQNSAGAIVLQLYYYAFGGVGAALKGNGVAGTLDNTDILADGTTYGTTLDVQAWLRAQDGGGGTEAVAVDDNGEGILTLTITNPRTIDYGAVELFFRAKGQVAGVPVNIDIAKCIGVARFQLYLR